MRVLVLLLHEFPEFLYDYHLNFCGVIPSSSIQMRNIIFSAFPHNMKVHDPFTPNLKIDLLPEIKKPPRIKKPPHSSLEVEATLTTKQMKSDIDEYLKAHDCEVVETFSLRRSDLPLSPSFLESGARSRILNLVNQFNGDNGSVASAFSLQWERAQVGAAGSSRRVCYVSIPDHSSLGHSNPPS